MGLVLVWLIVILYFCLIGLGAFRTHRRFQRVGKRTLGLLLAGLIVLIGLALAVFVAKLISDYLDRTLMLFGDAKAFVSELVKELQASCK